MSDQNKALVRSLFNAFNTGDLDRVDALVSEGYTYHGPGLELTGADAVKELMTSYRTAFPDATITVVDQIAEGDKVVTLGRATGTHDGPLDTIPASGETVDLSLIAIHRIENGRLAEEWELFEELQMLQQIGAIASEEAA